jgi:hypothetical protein
MSRLINEALETMRNHEIDVVGKQTLRYLQLRVVEQPPQHRVGVEQ